ncbi:MAG: Glu-tRNA(Gln) amidotransferase subunit GatE [Nanobdellota archaeon]
MKNTGFKCGIEIHQQLEGRKLFCNCPTTIRKDEADYSIKRNLRASAGETGKFDKAAKYEQEKRKDFIYNGYYDTNCLVELDEEPPNRINEDALKAALQFCSMIGAKVPDRIMFMRKVVVDGSNTTGFQRTALVGMDGHVEVNGKKIRIPSVCLEEEACQVMERTEDKDIYNLSRLGIPLLEIATSPDIETPEECREVAGKIGMLLRSTGKCKRGIGSIRQDVNVSIRDGVRVEIKGFQDLKTIPDVINHEIKRQKENIEKNNSMEPHVRKAEPDSTTSYLRPMPGADRMYPETDVPLITPSFDHIKEVKTIEERQEELKEEFKLNDDFAKEAVEFEDENELKLKDFFKQYSNLKPKDIINFLINQPKEIKKRHSVDYKPLDNRDLLDHLNKGDIAKSSIEDILVKRARGEEVNIEDYKAMSEEKVREELKKILEENKDAPFGALMGKAMSHFQGRVDGKTVSRLLKELSN